MRDFFLDKDGHMWVRLAANNRVGYFYLSGKAAQRPRSN